MVNKLIVWDELKSEKYLEKHLNVVKSYVYSVVEFNKLNKLNLNYPLFIKIISDNAIHKVKAKAINEILNEQKFLKEKINIVKRAKELNAKKIIIQEKIYGNELIIGVKEDLKFGKILMIGIGGKHAEQIKDVSIRALPIKKQDLTLMISNLKSKVITLDIDIDNLWLFISKLLKFLKTKEGKNIKFMDLNPVILDYNSKKPIIVDARIYV
mgnify:CR=1 FL=1